MNIFLEIIIDMIYYSPLAFINFIKAFAGLFDDDYPNKNSNKIPFTEDNDKPPQIFNIDREENNLNNTSDFISVIIPCYNEENELHNTLNQLIQEVKCEIIVSDGGSTDSSLSILNEYENIKIIKGGKNRSESLNLGALESCSPILLFLHADTKLPNNWGNIIRTTLTNPKYLLGTFSFDLKDNIKKSNKLFNWVIYWTNIRSKWLSLPYGDQGLFLKRSTFNEFGGFPAVSLMEDYDFVISIRNKSWFSVKTVNESIQTSARRWLHLGIFTTFIVNQLVIFGNCIGVPRERLVKWYYGLNKLRNY